MLNIQPLVVRSLSHSPSSLKCEENKVYNKKMQFAHTIIQDIYRFKTSIIEFLHKRRRGWSSSVQVGLKATSVDLVNIEELEEDKSVEQWFVEAQAMQKDAKEEQVFDVGVQPSIEVHMPT